MNITRRLIESVNDIDKEESSETNTDLQSVYESLYYQRTALENIDDLTTPELIEVKKRLANGTPITEIFPDNDGVQHNATAVVNIINNLDSNSDMETSWNAEIVYLSQNLSEVVDGVEYKEKDLEKYFK